MCCDLCTAFERPHQAKQFHVRFIEREKMASWWQEGKSSVGGRDQSGFPLYMDGDIATSKGGS